MGPNTDKSSSTTACMDTVAVRTPCMINVEIVSVTMADNP